jgi:hypothetical protein
MKKRLICFNLALISCFSLLNLVTPSKALAGREVRREIREGAREIRRERREAAREVLEADSPEEARRAIREGRREVRRERREMRREVRREIKDAIRDR